MSLPETCLAYVYVPSIKLALYTSAISVLQPFYHLIKVLSLTVLGDAVKCLVP